MRGRRTCTASAVPFAPNFCEAQRANGRSFEGIPPSPPTPFIGHGANVVEKRLGHPPDKAVTAREHVSIPQLGRDRRIADMGYTVPKKACCLDGELGIIR